MISIVTCDTKTNASIGWLSYKQSHNRSLKENSFCKTKKENLLICSLTINGNEAETKVKES